MAGKRGLGMSVLDAARQRIAWVLETFPRVYVSFSGGKDSTVLLHLVMEQVQARGGRVGVLFIDLEAQYQLTIAHVRAMFDRYADHIEPYWVALPISLRNAVSVYQPQWQCWDPARAANWVRPPDPMSITDPAAFPFFRAGMEFEEFTPAFGHWFGRGQLTAGLVGIRADESLNRWRTLRGGHHKSSFEGRPWTTYLGRTLYNAYPIYDWATADIWTYHGVTGLPSNPLYDRMHQAGLTPHQMRICQPYGDDQRRGLWLYHVIEPETWARVVARVNGANGGALYVRESGNVTGYRSISRPPGHTWQSFARLLVGSMPPATQEHYENKILVFVHWWSLRGYPDGIPDEAEPVAEAARRVPSWRRICKSLLRNDYWCKGLSFTQHKSENYERYQRIMRKRRAQWGSI